ncbi:MAG: hypothetical protein HYY06_08360 [Deltaproteobacteria bacterium]|nr:hypothetical protein [Deltaproteobacteria bacterium]
MPYPDADTLLADHAAALFAGVSGISIYSLDGVVEQDEPGAWIDAGLEPADPPAGDAESLRDLVRALLDSASYASRRRAIVLCDGREIDAGSIEVGRGQERPARPFAGAEPTTLQEAKARAIAEVEQSFALRCAASPRPGATSRSRPARPARTARASGSCPRERLGVRGYVRYMDDVLCFGDDKRRLASVRTVLEGRLLALRLRAHPRKCEIAATRAGVPFLGFLLLPDRTRLLGTGVRQIARRLRALRAAGDPAAGARSLAGIRGHACHADARRLLATLVPGEAAIRCDGGGQGLRFIA